MTDTLICPRCEEPVPDGMLTFGQVSSGPVLNKPNIKYAQCPNCKASLRRVIDIPDTSWHMQRGVEQPPWPNAG